VAEIRIRREHALGLASARKLAYQWAEAAENRMEMKCTYEEGDTFDRLSFKRSGVHGELRVTADAFELEAKLGMLMGMFKSRIEQEINMNLDLLLAQDDPHTAFQDVLDKHVKRKA